MRRPPFYFMKKFFLLLFCSFVCIWRADAGAENFSYSPEWLKLLHYHQKADGDYKGLVDNKEFYLCEDGRENPQKELAAEITAFASGSAKCLFPARFKLLKKKQLVKGNLQDCSEYRQFIDDVRPKGITLLFTNAYMSNPASLFGHTLIRIDTARKGTQMLAHGVNFGANSGTEYGFVFALKGLFGGYEGVYSISPYWEIINTYNNIENRDIWEYSLNLTDEEKEIFVDHLFEMKNAEIRYYFLSKNCSYMILELLEAVRPGLELTRNFSFEAIPLDTLKEVKSVPGLINKITYRPARYTRIKHAMAQMSEKQYEVFLDGLKNYPETGDELSETEKAEVLETQYQYYQYRYTIKDMELADYRRKSFAVLKKRSLLPAVKISDPQGEDPTFSRESAQVSLGGGVFRHRSFEHFEFRPAYTSLNDNAFGLIKGAEVSVLKSDWRYYNQKHKFVLQEFTPLEIKSLVPSGRVFTPISYSLGLVFKRAYNPQADTEGYIFSAYGGVGRTYDIKGIWLYGLLKTGLSYGGFIPGNFSVGVIPEIGVYKNWERWRWQILAEEGLMTRRFDSKFSIKTTLTYDISANLSCGGEYTYNRVKGGREWKEFVVNLRQSF